MYLAFCKFNYNSDDKVSCVNQALDRLIEYETRANKYSRTDQFAHRHVCNKCLQHLATSSTCHSCITWDCISSLMQAMLSPGTLSHLLHHNPLTNTEVWRCLFICMVRRAIHIIVIQFPDVQNMKFTIPCFGQHQL